MSNTVYRVQHYMKYTLDEFWGILVTTLFAAFILTFNDWGDAAFDLAMGLTSLALMFIFLLFAVLLTTWVCKVVAIRLGYTITYRPHLAGLIFGLFVTVASRGYLPLFLPGGFDFRQPERLLIGKWHGLRKGWEMALISAAFPLTMLFLILLVNPLYLLTKAPIYLDLVVACCLFAIFALVPAPMITLGQRGDTTDWFRYLRGTTFGLDIMYTTRGWWAVMIVATLIFSLLAWILTFSSIGIGIFIYILSLVLGTIIIWTYAQFFK